MCTNLSLREGRFLAETGGEHRRSVLVAGHNVAQALFGPLGRVAGREVSFAGRPFTVIGVRMALGARRGDIKSCVEEGPDTAEDDPRRPKDRGKPADGEDS